MTVMETVTISEKKVCFPALLKYPLSYNETLTVNHFYFSIKSCFLAALNFQSEAKSLFLKGRRARIQTRAKCSVVAFAIQT